ASPDQQLLRAHLVQVGQRLAQRGRLRIGIAPAGRAHVGRIGPGRFVGVEPDLALQPVAARRAVAGEAAQVLTHQGEHAPVAVHAASTAPALRRRRRTALACASRPSASARVTAQGPMAAMPAPVAACTLTKFWKLDTDTPLYACAAPAVGSTWLVPLQ